METQETTPAPPVANDALFAFWEAGWRQKFNAFASAYQMACERHAMYPFHDEIVLAEYRLACAVRRREKANAKAHAPQTQPEAKP